MNTPCGTEPSPYSKVWNTFTCIKNCVYKHVVDGAYKLQYLIEEHSSEL